MLEVLSNAVDDALAIDALSLCDADLQEVVESAQRHIDRLHALQARLVSEWDGRNLWSNDGSRSAGHRLARKTGLSITAAKSIVTRSRRLRTMPLCEKAFADGKLSTSRIDLLAQANQPDVADLFRRDESLLLSAVTDNENFWSASRAVHYWSQCADEAGSENRAQMLVKQRSASATRTFEGSVDLRALFDPVSGEIFLSELDRIEKQLFEADWAAAKQVHGDAVSIFDLERANTQRRCDALVEMARRSAASITKARPLISVIVDYQTFAQRVCELASGTVITPGQIVPLLGEADIERVVFDSPSRVVEVGRKRFFTGALRRAIEIRDRHCQHPSGCDVPASSCDVDHTLAFARNGPTDWSNGQLSCPKHNRAKGTGPP